MKAHELIKIIEEYPDFEITSVCYEDNLGGHKTQIIDCFDIGHSEKSILLSSSTKLIADEKL